MDGIHDLGGKHGFGPVVREVDEPVFHHRWEAKVFAMMRAAVMAGVVQNADQFRHAIERIDPVAYLTHGYYGRWLGGLETLFREAAVVEGGAIAGGSAAGSRRSLPVPPRFAVGDQVRTAATGKRGHTRLPAYARGRRGIVVACHGGWVFPDTNAHGDGERPQHLYTVRFAGRVLWGDEAEPNTSVALDLFESYLEAAS